jgi:Uma2 family endonuclease
VNVQPETLTMATDYKKKPSRTRVRKRKPLEPEPTWEIARLFPRQGCWTEQEFFSLPDNHFIEFSKGFLTFLPMPTIFHQLILQYLYEELKSFVKATRSGIVVVSGYKVRGGPDQYREPDILFIKTAHLSGIEKQYCKKVDLVIEVVSEDNREHDLVTKRDEYARAGIPEYWIVDPEEETITVLALKRREKTYVEHGVFRKGERAASKVLPGFRVDVTAAITQRPETPR